MFEPTDFVAKERTEQYLIHGDLILYAIHHEIWNNEHRVSPVGLTSAHDSIPYKAAA